MIELHDLLSARALANSAGPLGTHAAGESIDAVDANITPIAATTANADAAENATDAPNTDNASLAGDVPVCRDGATLIGFRSFRAHTLGIAAQLRAQSLQAGQRVALCTDDPYAFACTLFALLVCGLVPVIPANATPGYLADLAHAYDRLLTHDDVAALLDRADGMPAHSTSSTSSADSVESTGDLAIRADAPLTLFTSGSSGTPKPVHKTLAQFNAEVQTLERQWGAHLGDATILASVPHHHIYGMLFRIFWPLAAGRAFARATCIDPQQVQVQIAHCGATAVVSTPSQLSRWPELPGFAELHPLPRAFFSSGGPLASETATQFAETFGVSPFEIFGSTETGGIAWRAQHLTQAWTPMPGIAVRRADDGALEVRSTHIGHDGWYTTDDEATFDDEGRFRLQGRLDRVHKIEGKRVSLSELETRLRQHAFVAQAATVLLDGTSRQRIGALVALSDAGQHALHTEGRVQMAKTLRRHLAAYVDVVVLPRYWRFRRALPYDARGKLSAVNVARAFQAGDEGFEILAESANEGERLYDLHVPRTLAHFDGHFEGLPILPGVVQIDWAVRLASVDVPAVRSVLSVDQIKFTAPVPPGVVLRLALKHDVQRHRVAFRYRLGERDCASGVIVYGERA